MIKLVPIMDKNNIMADKDFNENLKFLSNIMPELNCFAEIVKNGDVIIGVHAFWEAVLELDGLSDFKTKNVYIVTNKTFAQVQAMHSQITLPSNIKVITNLDKIINLYQGNKTDIFIWGGVRTINNLGHFADQIILIRTAATRKSGLKFNHDIFKNFMLIKAKNYDKFQVEIYYNKKSPINL